MLRLPLASKKQKRSVPSATRYRECSISKSSCWETTANTLTSRAATSTHRKSQLIWSQLTMMLMTLLAAMSIRLWTRKPYLRPCRQRKRNGTRNVTCIIRSSRTWTHSSINWSMSSTSWYLNDKRRSWLQRRKRKSRPVKKRTRKMSKRYSNRFSSRLLTTQRACYSRILSNDGLRYRSAPKRK